MLKLVRFWATACLVLLTTLTQAQTFSTTVGLSIPDSGGVEHQYPISVSGLQTTTGSTFGLVSMCFNITHTYDSDLDLVLVNPAGNRILLFSHVGGSGDNFSGTCLANDAPLIITNGSAPFVGAFRAQSDLNGVNNGTNPNGTWYLAITDRIHGDGGTLNNFSLTFGDNPPVAPPPPPTPCSFTNMASCECPDGTQDCDLLPDMTSSARILIDQHQETVGWIRASNGTPNIGYGPMEIHGTGVCYCDSVQVACSAPCPVPVREKVEQTIYHKSGSTYTSYRRTAGYMAYHPTHGHHHVDAWARFTLRLPGADPDPRTWHILGTGTKVSYCLINVGTCSAANGYCINDAGQVMDADTMPNAGLGRSGGCATDQGVWPGRLDVYGMGSDGQEVDLTGLCNGTYYLVSETDPDNVFLEMNEENNMAVVPITLTQQPAPTPTPFNARLTGAFTLVAAANIPPLVRFTWDFGDGETDTTNSIVQHDFPGPGTYHVRLTIHHLCGDTSTMQTFTIVATKTLASPEELALKAEPNPSKGSFRLTCRKPSGAPATARIMDLAGHTLRTVTVTGSAGKASTQVSTDGMPAGLYVLQLDTEIGKSAIRLVVE